MNETDVYTTINSIQSSLMEVEWFVGGSAALVMQGYCNHCNDLDIIQHTSHCPISLPFEYKKRLWSCFYYEPKIDMHFSSVDNLNAYPKCFHKIIRALYYIDSSYYNYFEGIRVVNPWGAGLVNWIHHFLSYGYNKSRTIKPAGHDIMRLMSILGKNTYETIAWKAERSEGKQDKDFYEFALRWKS